jgi:pantetheine-phosphate adenylyltransferase
MRFRPAGPVKATTMANSTPRVAVYTGSFDPITLGHVNVIERSCRLVDRLVVGIGTNVEKTSLFTPEERVELVQRVTQHLDNVEVRPFAGLAVSFVRQCQARVMVRGVRPLTDIAAEFTMMLANRELDPDIETIFLMADQRLAHVSSSLIKQITPLADDERLANFVPSLIIPDLRRKLAQQTDL